jgi:hypothetical protein
MSPGLRRLLLRIEVRPAGRESRCRHNTDHVIAKGEPRFILKGAGPASGEKGYCAACARAMIEDAREQLAVLDDSLARPPA